jgi:large subunit ribosomal protein L17
MRHRAQTHSFNRRQGPRLAMIKGLMTSLVEHGRIRTTVIKAKELRRHIERAITLGKKGTLSSRRLLISRTGCPDTADVLMTDLASRFKTRNGGYTRILKTGPRPGDGAEMALIEFVDFGGTTTPAAAGKKAKTKTKAAKAEEVVQGDADRKTRVRLALRKAEKKRKTLRQLQGKARQVARALAK